jgi:hypothetical protein
MRVHGTVRRRCEGAPIGACSDPVRRILGMCWRHLAALALLLASPAIAANPAGARDPDSPLRIPLEPMGFQTIAQEFMLAGDSMLTVDFVDNGHLLITFSLRRLMKREADSLPDDDDRTIGAFLVELPSGKVLARTEWRLHDRLRYLWNLGHGRFLLRIRDRLTMIAPLAAADPNDAFQQILLSPVDRHIVAILVSSDNDLLTVYSIKRPAATGQVGQVLFGDSAPTETAPVQINFYRLINTSEAAEDLQIVPAGAIRTGAAASLPMTTAGFLDVLEGARGTWLFNFDEHAGKVNELLAFDTSCFPRATFVDHSEFVVFGCRGSDDKPDFAGFNLKGDEMWQQNFSDAHVDPMFSFAPVAGRFALGRTLVGATVGPDTPLVAGQATAQEIRVYQSYNGKQLLRINCTPMERAGQNFALSADGMQLAVVREAVVHYAATKDYDAYTRTETGVEIYALPPLAKEDRTAVEAAQKLAPADTGARIDLALQRVSASDAAQAQSPAGGAHSAGGDSSTPAPVAPVVDASQQATPAAAETSSQAGDAATTAEGDPEPSAPRKPPTLYGPGEKPDDKPQ